MFTTLKQTKATSTVEVTASDQSPFARLHAMTKLNMFVTRAAQSIRVWSPSSSGRSTKARIQKNAMMTINASNWRVVGASAPSVLEPLPPNASPFVPPSSSSARKMLTATSIARSKKVVTILHQMTEVLRRPLYREPSGDEAVTAWYCACARCHASFKCPRVSFACLSTRATRALSST